MSLVRPKLRPNIPPPPHYYADNLTRLLGAVASQYSDILLDRERDYLRRVLDLSADAQRLYARLLTRRGPLIRIDSLTYREVSDAVGAMNELTARSLVDCSIEAPADQLLDMLTRDELAGLFPHVHAQGERKGAQVTRICARYPDRRTREVVGANYPMCGVCDPDMVDTAQILFFGDSYTDLSTFVLEDLGMLRFESYQLDARHRQFGERAELDDFLAMRALRGRLHRLESCWDRAVAGDALDTLWVTAGSAPAGTRPRNSAESTRTQCGTCSRLRHRVERVRKNVARAGAGAARALAAQVRRFDRNGGAHRTDRMHPAHCRGAVLRSAVSRRTPT